MLHSSKFVCFVMVSDAEKARHFYGDLLGLRFVAEQSHELVFDTSGILFRVLPVPEPTITPYTVCGWQVADLRAEVHALTAKGVAFERFDLLTQDEDGISTFPDGEQFAWFKDPDGNLLSLSQSPSSVSR